MATSGADGADGDDHDHDHDHVAAAVDASRQKASESCDLKQQQLKNSADFADDHYLEMKWQHQAALPLQDLWRHCPT